MKVLGLDLSTKSGWAIFEDGQYKESGVLRKVNIDNFNVNKDPNKCTEYPYNIMDAAKMVAYCVQEKISEIKPHFIVIENSVKGKNRHTQRLIEFIHFCVLSELREHKSEFKYIDPGEWRFKIGLKLNKEQKKNNKEVSQGKKRGKVTRKHLSVNFVNNKFGLNLKLKDNDEADAINLTYSYFV